MRHSCLRHGRLDYEGCDRFCRSEVYFVLHPRGWGLQLTRATSEHYHVSTIVHTGAIPSLTFLKLLASTLFSFAASLACNSGQDQSADTRIDPMSRFLSTSPFMYRWGKCHFCDSLFHYYGCDMRAHQIATNVNDQNPLNHFISSSFDWNRKLLPSHYRGCKTFFMSWLDILIDLLMDLHGVLFVSHLQQVPAQPRVHPWSHSVPRLRNAFLYFSLLVAGVA